MVRVFSEAVGFYLVTRVCLTSGILTTPGVAVNSAGQTTSSLSLAHSYPPAAAIVAFPKQRQRAAYVERKLEDGTEVAGYSGRGPLPLEKTLAHPDGKLEEADDAGGAEGSDDRRNSRGTPLIISATYPHSSADRLISTIPTTKRRAWSGVEAEASAFIRPIKYVFSEQAARFSPATARFLAKINRDYARTRIPGPKSSASLKSTSEERGGGSDRVKQDASGTEQAFKLQETRIGSDYGAPAKIRPSSRSPEVEVWKGLERILGKVGSDEVKVDAVAEESEGGRDAGDSLRTEGQGQGSERLLRVVKNGLSSARADVGSDRGILARIRSSSGSAEVEELGDSLYRIVGPGELRVDALLGRKEYQGEINVGRSSRSEGRKEASDRSSYKVFEDGLTTYPRPLTNFPDQGRNINLDHGRPKIIRPPSRSPSELPKSSKPPYKPIDSANFKSHTLQQPTQPSNPEEFAQGQTEVQSSRSEPRKETSKRSSYDIFEDPDPSTSSGSSLFAGAGSLNFRRPKEWEGGYREKVVGSQDLTGAITALDRFLSDVLNDGSYNVVQHPPTNPVLALVLSRYGRYVPGTRNPRYYSYMAVNNIHNNRPFGKYKHETDEELSHG